VAGDWWLVAGSLWLVVFRGDICAKRWTQISPLSLGMIHTLIDKCVEFMKQEDAQAKAKALVRPFIQILINEIYPYIIVGVFLVIVSFFLILAIFILLLRTTRIAQASHINSSLALIG
jgi:hypothetical protein